MGPMEAWRVISRNLANYYRMRCTETFNGYDGVDTEAEVIAFKALQEMEERMSKADKSALHEKTSCAAHEEVL